MFKSSSDVVCVLLTVKGSASFVDYFSVSCLSSLSCLVCSLQPCGHLLEKG